MGGALMDLVAVGAQDVYLTANPSITFFQSVYKRATPFAMETMSQVINGSVGNGSHVSVTIARNGDLIGPMYLEATAKAVADDDKCWLAEQMISQIELTIGGQRIDRHYSKWFRLYSELHMNDEKKASYAKLTSGASNQVMLPLQFFFNKNPGHYLALVALQYHEVRLDIDLASDFDNKFSNLKVWGTYVFLDTEERKRYAGKQHEILIEQVQHTGSDAVAAGSETSVRLSFNHPVKELAWCLSVGQGRSFDVFNGAAASLRIAEDAATAASDKYPVAPNRAGCPVVVADASENTAGFLSQAKLMLNGQDRFKEQGAKYFNQMVQYLHYEGSPHAGVYAYPFALRPGDSVQATGSCNFSRIDNAQFTVTPRNAADTLHLFAVNWNVLRISSGLGGLAFSN